MIFFKRLILICLLIAIVIPAAQAEAFMKKALNSWVGYSIDDVIESWGYPSDERTLANRHLYYWNAASTTYIPSQTRSTITPGFYDSTVNTITSGGYTIDSYCNKILEVDKNNKVISWQYRGNACPKFYYRGKHLVNPQNDEWERQKALKRALKEEQKRLKQEAKAAESL